MEAGAGPGSPQQGAGLGLDRRGRNRLAIAALVCGIMGMVTPLVLFCVPSVVAIILGSVSLSQIRNSGGQSPGRGQALAGVVLGVVAVVGSLLLLAFLYWWDVPVLVD